MFIFYPNKNKYNLKFKFNTFYLFPQKKTSEATLYIEKLSVYVNLESLPKFKLL